MKFVLFLGALIVGSIVGIHMVLQNGSLLRYLDEHPDLDKVPPLEFFIGNGYYAVGELQQSATYYQRISERYPKSSYADDAYYNYLLSLDDMNTPRQAMADLYQTYLDRFPDGIHADMVQHRIMNCRNAH